MDGLERREAMVVGKWTVVFVWTNHPAWCNRSMKETKRTFHEQHPRIECFFEKPKFYDIWSTVEKFPNFIAWDFWREFMVGLRNKWVDSTDPDLMYVVRHKLSAYKIERYGLGNDHNFNNDKTKESKQNYLFFWKA